MIPRFSWTSAYRGEVDYDVVDDTGRYRASLRYEAPEYEGGRWNYTPAEFARDIVGSLGLLRCSDSRRLIPRATIEAFNAWREDKFRTELAHLQANPERYGEIVEGSEPWLTAPTPARAAHYVVGTGWVVDHELEKEAS